MLTHTLAVDLATYHGRAYVRDHEERHLDIIEDLHQRTESPALFLTDTVARLGRHNALTIGLEPHLVETCLRLHRTRADRLPSPRT